MEKHPVPAFQFCFSLLPQQRWNAKLFNLQYLLAKLLQSDRCKTKLNIHETLLDTFDTNIKQLWPITDHNSTEAFIALQS